MARRTHTLIGRENGKRYKLVYDKMCNQGVWIWKTWRWFLFTRLSNNQWDFQGDFGTKREAINWFYE